MVHFRSAAAGFRARLGKGLCLISLGLLGACASFQAHPEPVLDTIATVNSANINIRSALIAFESDDARLRENLEPKAYRNMVIGTYLLAADQRYLQFRRRLAAEARGSSLLLDIGILGLSGGASLAGETTANALAAGAAGLTGTRAAVSRDVYFDRTVPAMIGVMDAERTRIRTLIMVGLRKSAEEYPLAVALGDASSYEAAASLDAAIEVLTQEAAERSETANMNYADEVANYTRPPEPGVADIKRRIRTHLRALRTADNRAALTSAATAVGIVAPAADAALDTIVESIEDAMYNARTVAAVREFATKVGLPAGDN